MIRVAHTPSASRTYMSRKPTRTGLPRPQTMWGDDTADAEYARNRRSRESESPSRPRHGYRMQPNVFSDDCFVPERSCLGRCQRQPLPFRVGEHIAFTLEHQILSPPIAPMTHTMTACLKNQGKAFHHPECFQKSSVSPAGSRKRGESRPEPCLGTPGKAGTSPMVLGMAVYMSGRDAKGQRRSAVSGRRGRGPNQAVSENPKISGSIEVVKGRPATCIRHPKASHVRVT